MNNRLGWQYWSRAGAVRHSWSKNWNRHRVLATTTTTATTTATTTILLKTDQPKQSDRSLQSRYSNSKQYWICYANISCYSSSSNNTNNISSFTNSNSDFFCTIPTSNTDDSRARWRSSFVPDNERNQWKEQVGITFNSSWKPYRKNTYYCN